MLKIGERGKNMNDVGLEKKENNLLGFEEMFKPKEGIEHQVFSTIKDGKVLFNLDSEIDYRLNECIGEKINIRDLVIKIFKKEVKEKNVDEETGEILPDEIVTKTKMVCIIIDDEGQSYVTGSKMFTMQMMRLIEMLGIEEVQKQTIEIIKKSVKNSDNKALGFKLL